ncbi:MAG TPA: LPXTG cell wall anchor domain-containing protein [Acidimicrobiia bacterium]|nr:LPXTG cell wall anchor domain-containing protein [Acidimicrobiia bacterium]
MAIRRLGAVLALSTIAVVGTASAAAARDYPPTTSSVVSDGSATTPTTVAAPASAATGLPFTGSSDTELVWVGLACAGAGALVVARTRRGHRDA